MNEYAAVRRIRMGFNTNGTLLTPDKSQRLMTRFRPKARPCRSSREADAGHLTCARPGGFEELRRESIR
jgi:hypothetical protein